MKTGRQCSTCGRGTLGPRRVERTYHFKGLPVAVPDVLVLACDTCGEKIISSEERRRARTIAQQKAADIRAAG